MVFSIPMDIESRSDGITVSETGRIFGDRRRFWPLFMGADHAAAERALDQIKGAMR
jgi:hypothetical protein